MPVTMLVVQKWAFGPVMDGGDGPFQAGLAAVTAR